MPSIVHVSIKYFIFAIFSMFLGVFSVSAMEYTPNTNLFENSYSNNLIDMAVSQIDNFTAKNFVVFQIDYDYYLVVADDVTVNSYNLVFNNSTVIRAQRTSSGYNSYYDYSTYTETQTVVNTSYVLIGNVPVNRVVSSALFDNYLFNANVTRILIFLLGISFAAFLTKGRCF